MDLIWKYVPPFSQSSGHGCSKFMSLVIETINSGLPRSGKNIWKIKFFPCQGKVREFCGWPGKFRKDLESQGF